MRCWWLFPALLLAASGAPAHDLWVVGENGRVLVRIGEDFPVSTNGITADRIVLFRAVGHKDLLPLEGRAEEKQFAAALPASFTGPVLVELEVKPRLITLAAPDFNRYIREEGFAGVIAARQAAGKTDTAGREKYSRYAKLLVDGPGEDHHLLAPRGHRLEILFRSNPARLPPGADLVLQILFEGKPLPGVEVSAGPAGMMGHQFPCRARTDAQGLVQLAVHSRGRWYARLIHMIPSTETDAEWRSFFATAVFER